MSSSMWFCLGFWACGVTSGLAIILLAKWELRKLKRKEEKQDDA